MISFRAIISFTYLYYDEPEKDRDSASQIEFLRDWLSEFSSFASCEIFEHEVQRRDLDSVGAILNHYEFQFHVTAQLSSLKLYRGLIHLFQGFVECASSLYFHTNFQIVDSPLDPE